METMIQVFWTIHIPYWAVHQKTLDVLRKNIPCTELQSTYHGQRHPSLFVLWLKMFLGPCIERLTREATVRLWMIYASFWKAKTDAIMKAPQKATWRKIQTRLIMKKPPPIRDQINAIERVVERQKIVSDSQQDSDIIAMARWRQRSLCASVLQFVRGKNDRQRIFFEGTNDRRKQWSFGRIHQAILFPGCIYPQKCLLAKMSMKQYHQDRLNTKRVVRKLKSGTQARGKCAELVEMATENAKRTLTALETAGKLIKTAKRSSGTIQSALDMPAPPNRIEVFRRLQYPGHGKCRQYGRFWTVALQQEALPALQHPRCYRSNDYASMVEALHRRFANYEEALQHKDEPGKKQDLAFSLLPIC